LASPRLGTAFQRYSFPFVVIRITGWCWSSLPTPRLRAYPISFPAAVSDSRRPSLRLHLFRMVSPYGLSLVNQGALSSGYRALVLGSLPPFPLVGLFTHLVISAGLPIETAPRTQASYGLGLPLWAPSCLPSLPSGSSKLFFRSFADFLYQDLPSGPTSFW